nr:hypothetical protein BaRGS_002822 [Batillaria attramentaria]
MASYAMSLMRGASPYRYSPESHDLHSRSPYGPGVIVSSSSSLSPYSGEMGRGPHPHSPSSGFLVAPVISSSSGGVIPRQDGFRSTSDADLSASSSLLLLSNTASAIANISTPPAQPNYPDGAWQERENSRYGRAGGEVQQRHSPMEEDRDHHEVPSPMAGEHRRASAFQQQSHVHNSMPPHPCGPAPLHHAFTRPGVHGFGDHDPNSVKPGDADSTHENQANDKLSGSQTERSLPPPSAAAQQRPPFPDLITSSSKPSGAGEREEEPRRFVKIKDTTALAELRARREKEAAEKAQTRKRQALFNPADRENTSDSSSSGDGSDSSDYIDGSIKPPDPNLKMSPLDYLISEVLVKRIDIPFKPCNTEIKKNFRLNKGKLRLVDLIELQVEQSLKA